VRKEILSYELIVYKGVRVTSGALPLNQAGKALREIRDNYPEMYKKVRSIIKQVAEDDTGQLFRELKKSSKISKLTNAAGNDDLYEAKHPVKRKKGSGGVVRVYFAFSKQAKPDQMVLLDAEYKTGDPDYSAAVSRLQEYRSSDDK